MGDDRARDAVEDLRAAVAEPFERARAIPKSAYIAPDLCALEMERIFHRQWLCAGRADALPEAGTT